MNLKRALRASATSKIAFVGAGGKTTAVFQLARQMNPPVVVTTTTHLGEWQLGLGDRHFVISRPEDIDSISGSLEGVTVLTGPLGSDRRLAGLADESLDRLNQLSNELGFPILVEADGSRGLPLKAPGIHEPVIPNWVSHVVICQGMRAYGLPLNDQIAHRAEVFSRLSEIAIGDPVMAEGIARVICHSEGGLKGIPAGVRVTALLNQVSEKSIFDDVMRVANKGNNRIDSWIISNLEKQEIRAAVEPVAGILLAAGASVRYGEPKILLDWQGKPLIRHVAETALAGGLDPVIVVLGAVVETALQALEGLPVHAIVNRDWEKGQSTSVRAGLAAVPVRSGAGVFLLVDQPRVKPSLLKALTTRHQQTLAPVIAPFVNGQRSNPVLFDRDTFVDLAGLSGDTGGRAIFHHYEVEAVDWDDPTILFDIDTPDDYETLHTLG